jgi:hypothetical protein
MKSVLPRLENELRRLGNGPFPKERSGGLGTVSFSVRCPIGPADVLARAKDVLKIIDEATFKGWPGGNASSPNLPKWFVLACVEEMTTEQAKQWLDWWRSLPAKDQAKVELEKDWSLDNWLYWMEPSNRQWFWWDAKILEDSELIEVAIEVEAWPFPWGALRWLFRAAGAAAMEAEK